jgi:hypothetical protein
MAELPFKILFFEFYGKSTTEEVTKRLHIELQLDFFQTLVTGFKRI